ncbi:hypothetical protein [Jatrophihabitans fulvus]
MSNSRADGPVTHEGGADPASARQGALATTGSPNGALIGIGLALIVGGIGVTDLGRRRRRPQHS